MMIRETQGQNRKYANMLVWAILALTFFTWKQFVNNLEKGKEMENTTRSNQLQDKKQSYFRRANRAQCTANKGSLRRAKQITMGSTQDEPSDETTRVIKTKLPKDLLDEGQWNDMRREGDACRGEAWRVRPPTKRS